MLDNKYLVCYNFQLGDIDMSNDKKDLVILDRKKIFTIPNILTYLRIVCIPIIILLYLKEYNNGDNYWLSVLVFVVASVSDLLDGWIARKFDMGSDIGKILDPVADKLLHVSIILLLTFTGRMHWIFAALIFLKEGLLIIGGVVLVKNKVVTQANVWGKIAAMTLAAGILLAFFDGIWETFSLIFMIGGVIVTYYALYQYTIISYKAYKLSKTSNELVYFSDMKKKDTNIKKDEDDNIAKPEDKPESK